VERERGRKAHFFIEEDEADENPCDFSLKIIK